MTGAIRSPRGARLAGAIVAGFLAAACGNEGAGGTGDPTLWENPAPLKVTYVTASRHDGWERNKPIEFYFSAPLDKSIVNKPDVLDKALQIGIVTSSGRVAAKGSFHFKVEAGKERKDVLVFDPTRTSRSNEIGCADNPNGFDPLTTYDISIPTPATSGKYLTSIAGKPILEHFDSFFTTGDSYVREIVQPRYTGTDGQGTMGFDPPRKVNGEVPYNSRVLIVFDEAMDPTSFELGTTISVKNETLSAIQGQTVIVPGTFQPDLCGRTWKFVPSFSYGGAGYDIAVILTTGLKDLAGNPLGNPQTFRFRTEVKAGVPTVQVITESFDTTFKRDFPNTTADWGITTAGVLQGGAVTSETVNVALQGTQYPGGVRTRTRDHPFAQNGSAGVGHDQWVYTQGELGAAGAITQVGWGPSSNALFASNHVKVKVLLGHSQGDSVSTSMANNFDVGLPVKCADAAYIIPQRATIDPPCNADGCAVGYWPMPTFTNFFEYNGKNNVVLDVDATLGTNYQITRVFFGPVGFPNRHTFCATGQNTGTLFEPLVTDMQFTKKRRTTIAQSLFYDTGVGFPDFSTPILSPATQSGGTSMQVEWEAADGILFPIPGNPNNTVPDPTTFTGFLTNVDQLDGHRFIRFRVTFVANVTSGEVPVLNSIAVPYIF
jgi:hypothetical protein